MAGASFLFAAKQEWLPPLDAWMEQAAVFGLLLFTSLTCASLTSEALRFFNVKRLVVRWVTLRREKEGLRRYIEFMSPDEKKVLAYLLAKNQKTFTAATDGGYAATLLGRGIVRIAAQPGQHIDPENVPMTVPDHMWDVLRENREAFPFKPDRDGGHPWRVPWQLR